MSKQKASRPAMADYAFSQRFLDALRIGFNDVREQKAQLSTASDIAQHLHVQQPDGSDLDNMRGFERSVDCAVKAWRSATKIYSEIFESLVKATEADPSRSPSERRGHTAFVEMAKTASEAKRNADEFVLFDELRKAATETTPAEQKKARQVEDDEDGSSRSISNESSEEDNTSVDPTPTNPTMLHLLGRGPRPGQPMKAPKSVMNAMDGTIKSDSERRRALSHRDGVRSSNAYGTLGSSDKKAWQADERKRRREKKQAKRATQRLAAQGMVDASRDKASGHTEDTSKSIYEGAPASLNGAVRPNSIPASTSTHHVVPMVEYEDVSAEVDARIKAKQLKKEAAKQERKRKRESADSFQGGEVDVKAEKPKEKKRVKAEERAEVVDAVTKKHELEDAESIESELRRKRKKSKA